VSKMTIDLMGKIILSRENYITLTAKINLVMWAIDPRGMSEAVLFGAQFYLIMFANKLSRVSILETK